MFETTGSLATLLPVFTLVGFLALPLLSALVAALSFRPAEPGSERPLLPTIVSLTSSLGLLALAGVLAARLALLPRNYLFVQHIAQLGRLGGLDLSFDLAFDPRSATFAVIIGLVSSAATLHAAWSTRSGSTAVLGWTAVSTFGAMLLCIGDGFAPALAGLGSLSLGAWGLARGRDATADAISFGGNVTVLLGFVFLFWSLGGSFGPEGYDSDGAPRFVVVATGPNGETAPPGGPPAKSTLTMTSYAGALVSADDADLPGEPVASPFNLLVDPGVYTLRVQGGPATADVVIPRVALVAGRKQVLSPYGPTASFHVLEDQSMVPRVAVTGGMVSLRTILASRTIAGLRASAIVLLLVIAGALAHAYSLADRRGAAPLALVLQAIPPVVLAFRLVPITDFATADGALVVVLGCGSAVVLAARAACVDDGHRALRGVLASAASLAVATVGLGEPASALVLVSASIVGTSASLVAVEARRDVRWLGMACASAVGVLPGAGASSGYILAITTALGAAATTTAPAWAAFAALAAAAIIASSTFAALAAFRVYDAVIHASVREPGASRGQGALVVVLALIALIGGAALGVGTSTFGGTAVPLVRRLVHVAAPAAPKAVGAIAIALSIIASAGGVALARRVSAGISRPGWLFLLGRPYAVLAWTFGGFVHMGQFLHRSVRAMDRDIVDDVPAALGELVVAITRIGKRRAAPPADAASTDTAGSSDGTDRTDRTPILLLLAMMALIGSVVLSSLLLG
jgi:hypothetical protein